MKKHPMSMSMQNEPNNHVQNTEHGQDMMTKLIQKLEALSILEQMGKQSIDFATEKCKNRTKTIEELLQKPLEDQCFDIMRIYHGLYQEWDSVDVTADSYGDLSNDVYDFVLDLLEKQYHIIHFLNLTSKVIEHMVTKSEIVLIHSKSEKIYQFLQTLCQDYLFMVQDIEIAMDQVVLEKEIKQPLTDMQLIWYLKEYMMQYLDPVDPNPEAMTEVFTILKNHEYFLDHVEYVVHQYYQYNTNVEKIVHIYKNMMDHTICQYQEMIDYQENKHIFEIISTLVTALKQEQKNHQKLTKEMVTEYVKEIVHDSYQLGDHASSKLDYDMQQDANTIA